MPQRRLIVGLAGALIVAASSGAPVSRASAMASIPDSRFVRLLAKSHISLVADLYWIKMASLAVATRTPAQGKELLGWGDFLSDLDPKMFWPYAMGGLLGVIKVDSQTFNAEDAARLLAKGAAVVPDPRLGIYLAYTQMELLGDLSGAATTLRRTATMRGAPRYLGELATRLLATQGRFEAAREFATQMAASSDPLTREAFEYRLREIDQEEILAGVTAAVGVFRDQRARLPSSIAELVDAGLLPAAPIDPLGGAIVLKDDGTVIATSGERLRLRARGNR